MFKEHVMSLSLPHAFKTKWKIRDLKIQELLLWNFMFFVQSDSKVLVEHKYISNGELSYNYNTIQLVEGRWWSV